jgi:hypothetical protein
MTILPTSASSTETIPKAYHHFWAWFQKNEQSFFNVLKDLKDMNDMRQVEKKFLDKLSPKLDKLHPGIAPLVGMLDSTTAELVLSVDGMVQDIALVEELVDAAPVIAGWKITALKPATPIKSVQLTMEGCSFHADNMGFYVNSHANYPDIIAITVAHNDFANFREDVLRVGVSIFLDNYLGELVYATTIDELTIIDTKAAQQPLIPISDLLDYLIPRQQGLISKYMGTTYNADNATIEELKVDQVIGPPSTALINTNLLQWNAKASHPWVLAITIAFNRVNLKQKLLVVDALTHDLATKLPANEGCLNIGQQTTRSCRVIYFACQDFRKPSQVLRQFKKHYTGSLAVSYELYKDKYWHTFEEFNS